MANSNNHEELWLFYKIFIDDIRFSKKQQWNTVYLNLVAIGAILGFLLALHSKPELKGILSEDFLYWLRIICYFIGGLGIGYILRYHWSITDYRKEKKQLLNRFSSKKAKELAKKELEGFFGIDFWCFALPFSVLIAGALCLVVYVIVKIS